MYRSMHRLANHGEAPVLSSIYIQLEADQRLARIASIDLEGPELALTARRVYKCIVSDHFSQL